MGKLRAFRRALDCTIQTTALSRYRNLVKRGTL